MKTNRSRLRRCSVRKGVLRNFAKFTGKRDSGTGVFCEFSEISKKNLFYRTPPGDCSKPSD